MKFHEMQIQAITFEFVANHLGDPRSPIRTVYHVREREMLVPLANELEQLNRSVGQPCDPATLGPSLFMDLLRQDALRISPPRNLTTSGTRDSIDVFTVPGSAACDVIRLPPFCLVHTPGLFEGTLVQATISERWQPPVQQTRGMRIKL